jgi:ABC-2 type transport system ATP-binding protein
MYPFVKGREFLNFVCGVKNTDFSQVVTTMIQGFNLEDHLDVSFSEMSLGTQKKFMIVAGILGDPVVMIMDEPTNGLDVLSRQILIDYINANTHNKIFIIASHDDSLSINLSATQLILGNHPIRQFEDQSYNSISC